MDHFSPKNGPYPLNSELALRLFKKNLQNERANSYMKILLVIIWENNSFGAI